MKNIRFFLSENFPFSVVKFSIYLNRRVFEMGKSPDPSMGPRKEQTFGFLYNQKTIKRHMVRNVRKHTGFRTCAPSEYSDQPHHSRNLIRIFTGRILDSQRCKVSSYGQRRL